jgi:hypothetical protein
MSVFLSSCLPPKKNLPSLSNSQDLPQLPLTFIMNAHFGAAKPPQTIKASTSVAMISCRPPQEVSFHDQTQTAAMHCLSDDQ